MITQDPLISVIIPVKNAATILGRCLASLKNLDYPKERIEIIIADGLSTDDSRDVALKYGVKLVNNEKQVEVSGRNRAFQESGGDIIAFTDADCVFDAAWLKNSVKYFKDDSIGGVGGVVFTPEDSSTFEKAIDFLFRLAEVFNITAHRQNRYCVTEVTDIPGCNAIYSRKVLDKIMPVAEDILTAEDVWINFRIRESGYKLLLAPDVILWHYRRNSPKKFIRQIYRYAIGRLQVGRKSPKLLNIFHVLIGLAIPIILLAGIASYLLGIFFLFLGAIFIFFLTTILLALVLKRPFPVVINIPLVAVIFIISWSAGFLKELFSPLKEIKGK